VTILAWQHGGVAGGPPVVLIHGWAADGPSDWDATGWVRGLGDAGLAAYVCDLPGHGESSDLLIPPEAEPAAWTAAAILADLDRMGVIDIRAVGYAEGCLVAGHLAARGADRVRRLVLVGCDDRAWGPRRDEVAAALRDPQARLWSAEAIDAVALARADRRHHLPTLADWADRIAWPAPARLGALRIPVVLGVGTDDAERRERLPRLARLFHDARIVTAPGDRRGSLASSQMIDAVTRFLAEEGS
jgi:pimeloyl-ACP methyl ester carboxylesterase